MAISLRIAHSLLQSLPQFGTGDRYRYYSLNSTEFANYIEILPPEQRVKGQGKTRKGPNPLSEDQFLHMANSAVTIHQFQLMAQRHLFEGVPFQKQVHVDELSQSQSAQVKAMLEMLLAEQRTKVDPAVVKQIEKDAYERARKQILNEGALPGVEEISRRLPMTILDRQRADKEAAKAKLEIRKAEYNRRAEMIGFPLPKKAWSWPAIKKLNSAYAKWEIDNMAEEAAQSQMEARDRLAPTSPDQLPDNPNPVRVQQEESAPA